MKPVNTLTQKVHLTGKHACTQYYIQNFVYTHISRSCIDRCCPILICNCDVSSCLCKILDYIQMTLYINIHVYDIFTYDIYLTLLYANTYSYQHYIHKLYFYPTYTDPYLSNIYYSKYIVILRVYILLLYVGSNSNRTNNFLNLLF